MTDDYLMSWEEVAKILHKDKDINPKRNVREWLYRHGLKPFSHGLYVRELVEKVINEEVKKCYIQEKLDSIIMSGEQLEWEHRPLKSKSGLQDLLNQKMQQAMYQS